METGSAIETGTMRAGTIRLLVGCFFFASLIGTHDLLAATALETRDALFQQVLRHPSDMTLNWAYVKICVELGDTEAAIGSLERILFYAPDNAQVKAELGFLYYKINSHQMARYYLDAALASGALDDATRAKIAAIGPEVTVGVTGNRAFGTLQTGTRFQSNPAFNPDNATLRLAGQDYLLQHPRGGGDGNIFGIAQLGYDHDLGNQRGDSLETRFSGYVTRQFHVTDLNVGLFDLSVGPRMRLGFDPYPDWTVKPYFAGGQVLLGGARYLTSGGVGLVADLPFASGFALQPGVEIRYANFAGVTGYSSLATGDTTTVWVGALAPITPNISAIARMAFTRGAADADYQSYNAYTEELALLIKFKSLLPFANTTWSVSPYIKLLQTVFNSPNPFIDATTTQRDGEWQIGIVLDTPLTNDIGFVTNLEFAKVASTIPNYREHNLSVLSGPTLRF